MKTITYICCIVIGLCASLSVHSQSAEEKAFKGATTIRLYINDGVREAEVGRFAEFIDKTGFTVVMPTSEDGKLKVELNGDTISTNQATLYDFMMGDYQGILRFYPAIDESNGFYIGVDGIVSNTGMGGSFSGLRMQKGGKDANWAQKAMFKAVNNHLKTYPGVGIIKYAE